MILEEMKKVKVLPGPERETTKEMYHGLCETTVSKYDGLMKKGHLHENNSTGILAD